MTLIIDAAARAQDTGNVNEAAADVLLNALMLDGGSLDIDVIGNTTSADVERTINGASTVTLTVHDKDRQLDKSGILAREVDLLLPYPDVQVPQLAFRLVQVRKTGDDFKLTFEDREVALLRTHDTYLKASRGAVTRAQFGQRMVADEPTVGFYSPELTIRQPIASVVPPKVRRRRHSSKYRSSWRPGSVDHAPRQSVNVWQRPGDGVR